MKILKSLLATLLFSWGMISYGIVSPLPMLQSVSDKMITALTAEKKEGVKIEAPIIHKIVRQVLLPHVDRVTMAKLVLGRDIWTQASQAQRNKFIDQFTVLLIRNYSTALAEFDNEKVQFSPLRGTIKKREKVDSRIIQTEGPPVPVSYQLIYRQGKWMIYDLIVDNVSLVKSYRSQFADVLSNSGLAGLLKRLESDAK